MEAAFFRRNARQCINKKTINFRSHRQHCRASRTDRNKRPGIITQKQIRWRIGQRRDAPRAPTEPKTGEMMPGSSCREERISHVSTEAFWLRGWSRRFAKGPVPRKKQKRLLIARNRWRRSFLPSQSFFSFMDDCPSLFLAQSEKSPSGARSDSRFTSRPKFSAPKNEDVVFPALNFEPHIHPQTDEPAAGGSLVLRLPN